MAECIEHTEPSELLSFYGSVAEQLEELANYVRRRPQIDRFMAERLQAFADEIREDINSGVILESACRAFAGQKEQSEESPAA